MEITKVLNGADKVARLLGSNKMPVNRYYVDETIRLCKESLEKQERLQEALAALIESYVRVAASCHDSKELSEDIDSALKLAKSALRGTSSPLITEVELHKELFRAVRNLILATRQRISPMSVEDAYKRLDSAYEAFKGTEAILVDREG